jgi:hypothetical protein
MKKRWVADCIACISFTCSGAAAVAKAYPALMTYTRRMSYLLSMGGGFGGAVSSFQFDVAGRCCLGHSVRLDRAAVSEHQIDFVPPPLVLGL